MLVKTLKHPNDVRMFVTQTFNLQKS